MIRRTLPFPTTLAAGLAAWWTLSTLGCISAPRETLDSRRNRDGATTQPVQTALPGGGSVGTSTGQGTGAPGNTGAPPSVSPTRTSTPTSGQPTPTPTQSLGQIGPLPASIKSYFSGNPTDSTASPAGNLFLVGGGEEPPGLLEEFVRQSGRGDIVILRASGSDGYNSALMAAGANSVQSLVFSSSDGSDSPAVANILRRAEGIFLAGGDQSKYVNFWRGTAVAREIQAAARRGAVIGGTSAGLAVMGAFYFSAINDSVTSATALSNPYNSAVTLGRDFLALPFMDSTITDTHFGVRDRMGRFVTFIARILRDGWANQVKGIAVDESAALVVDAKGIGRVWGESGVHVYKVRSTQIPEVCDAGKPLTIRDLETAALDPGQTFNLSTWSGSGGSRYALSAVRGTLTSSNGSIYRP